MIRKLRLLDLGLLALAVVLGWQMRREIDAAQKRERTLIPYGMKPGSGEALAPLPKVEPLAATTYADVASKNLFSPDRNPNVIIEQQAPPPPKPVPPFPVARGVMLWGGVPPTVVLADKAGGQQKGYHPGEKIGEWKIVSVDNSYVVFEWDGKQFKKRIDELLDRTPILVAEAPAQAASGQQAAQKPVQSLAGNAASGPGIDIGANMRACVPGDKSASGTIVDGMKKIVTETPFGASCRWEQVK